MAITVANKMENKRMQAQKKKETNRHPKLVIRKLLTGDENHGKFAVVELKSNKVISPHFYNDSYEAGIAKDELEHQIAERTLVI